MSELKIRIMKRVNYIVLVCLLLSAYTRAQVSPPGMGDINAAVWTVLGAKWDLDSIGKTVSTSYVAIGQKSDRDNYNPFEHIGVAVIGEDIAHKIDEHQKLSYGLNYRQAMDYQLEEPHHRTDRAQEFRLNLKYGYGFKLSARWKWSISLNQEFRKFFAPDFSSVKENFQLRSRLKSIVEYQLTPKNNQRLSLGVEGLWSMSYLNQPRHTWTDLKYKAVHFLLYYMWDIPHSSFSADIGYMNNLMHSSDAPKWGAQYLVTDLVWHIPRRSKRQ